VANKKITQLNELIDVVYNDIAIIVDDPAVTPADKKCTAQNFVKGAASEGAISDIIDTNLTASKALVSDVDGKVSASATTLTEIGYVSGVTSAIQTQLDAKFNNSGGTINGDLYVNGGGYSYIDNNCTGSNGVSEFRMFEDTVLKAHLLYQTYYNHAEFANDVSAEYLRLLDAGGAELNTDLTVDNGISTAIIAECDNVGNASFTLNEAGAAKARLQYITTDNYVRLLNSTSGKSFKLLDAGGAELDTDFKPATAHIHDLGAASFGWQDIFSQNAVTVTSDKRAKENIKNIPLGLDFVNQLRPVSFKFKDIQKEAVTSEVIKEIQETELKEVEKTKVEVINGKSILKKYIETIVVPVFDEVPLYDEQDNEIGTHKLPKMKTVTEAEEVEPATNKTYKRNHNGFIAQEIKSTLDSLDLDSSLYCYDEQADKHMLRYEEFIPCLTKAIQEQQIQIQEQQTQIQELKAEIDLLKLKDIG